MDFTVFVKFWRSATRRAVTKVGAMPFVGLWGSAKARNALSGAEAAWYAVVQDAKAKSRAGLARSIES